MLPKEAGRVLLRSDPQGAGRHRRGGGRQKGCNLPRFERFVRAPSARLLQRPAGRKLPTMYAPNSFYSGLPLLTRYQEYRFPAL